MTAEQFREFENKLMNNSVDKIDISLIEMLEEAEESKRQGLVFSKEEAYNLFKRGHE